MAGRAGWVTINGTDYHLYRPPKRTGGARGVEIPSAFGPGDASEQQVARDVPRIWDDWSGGGGYSRRTAGADNVYAWCVGDARYPRVFTPGGQLLEITLPPGLGVAPPYGSFEADGQVFVLAGSHPIRVSQTTGLATTTDAFAADSQATSAVTYNGAVYVGVSGDFLWRYDLTTHTWTRSNDVQRDWLTTVYWVVGGVGAYRIVGAMTSTNRIKIYPSDPTAPGDIMTEAGWSAAYPIGSSDTVIRNLAASADHVYVVKTDGIHDVDGRGYSPNLTPYWRQQYNNSSGLTSVVHGGYVYAHHVLGLDRVRIGSSPDRDRPEWCQPGTGTPNEGPIFGTVRAVGIDGQWLVGAQHNGIDSYICYGLSRDQPGVPAGPGPILWHTALAKIPGVVVTFVKVHEIAGAPWLFIGGVNTGTAVPRLFRMAVARAAHPSQALAWPGQYGPGTYPFATTASITLPVDDWGDGTATKILRRFDVQGDDLGPAMLEVYAREVLTSVESGWVSQGQVATAPGETLLPAGTLTQGQQVGLRVDLNGTAQAPALLRALKARAAVRVELNEQRIVPLNLGQLQEGRNRARDTRDPEVMYAQLWPLQMSGPVEMTDHRGRDLTVLIDSVRAVDVEREGGQGYDLVAHVTYSIQQRPGYWDVSVHNTDAALSA